MSEYKLMREIMYRVRETYRAVSNGRDAMNMEDMGRVKDELANIFHQMEMIEFAHRKSEDAKDEEIREMFRESNRQAVESAAKGE